MKNTDATVRGARTVLAFYRKIYRKFGDALQRSEFGQGQLGGGDGYMPTSLYVAEDVLAVANFSAINSNLVEIWMEVALFLDRNGIALATLSSSLYEEPFLFIVEKEPDCILDQIDCDLVALRAWTG